MINYLHSLNYFIHSENREISPTKYVQFLVQNILKILTPSFAQTTSHEIRILPCLYILHQLGADLSRTLPNNRRSVDRRDCAAGLNFSASPPKSLKLSIHLVGAGPADGLL